MIDSPTLQSLPASGASIDGCGASLVTVIGTVSVSSRPWPSLTVSVAVKLPSAA